MQPPAPVPVQRNNLGLTPLYFAILQSLLSGAFQYEVERRSLDAMVQQRKAAAHAA